MIHMMGKCCLMVGLFAIGYQTAAGLKKRTICLQGFLSALGQMERELNFSLLPLPELLAQVRKGSRGAVERFFIACEAAFQERGEVRYKELWNDTLVHVSLPLREEDMEILREVGEILGQYDGENQQKALQTLQVRLEENVQKSKEEAERMGKVYVTLGVTLGLFCMILL